MPLDPLPQTPCSLSELRRTGVQKPLNGLIIRQRLPDPASSAFDRMAIRATSGARKKATLAIDLDDTILRVLGFGETLLKLPTANVRGSIRWWLLRPRVRSVLRHPRWSRRRWWYDSNRYPFLGNLPTAVVVRPGMRAALEGYRAAGARLVLVTASARERVEFLFQRLPWLHAVFGPAGEKGVVDGEDLIGAQLRALGDRDRSYPSSEEDEQCLAFLRRTGPCLACKAPLIVREATGVTYDLLVDDSPRVAEVMASCGSSHRMVRVEPANLTTPYVLDIVAAIAHALDSAGSREPVPLSTDIHPAFDPDSYPYEAFEDPLFYPLEHVRDRWTD